MFAGDHTDKNLQPSKLDSYTCNILVHAVSFCVQTDHIRQPLNNHTRPFYLLEFLSKVQNTACSLSGRHNPCRLGVGTDHSCYPGYASKIGAFETLTQIPRDISIPLGIPVTLT